MTTKRTMLKAEAAGNDSASTDNRFYIRTYRGHTFFWDDIAGNIIDIEDIAHALANNCRWGGHTSRFYSVAQHCFHTAQLVPHELKLEALLHDAAEAYVHDTPTPLKRHLLSKGFDAFAKLEQDIEREIARRFNTGFPLHDLVKEADRTMLATEHRDLMPDGRERPHMGTPAKFALIPWGPAYAEQAFLSEFRYLTN